MQDETPPPPNAASLSISLLLSGAFIVLGLALIFFSRPTLPKPDFEDHSDFSHIRVRSDGSIRSLLFVRDNGQEVVESRMDVENPHRLMLGYSKSMFASHLVHSAPKRVLVVGLGGGGMIHYLSHHFPATRVDALEIDPMVVDVADRFFGTRSSDTVQIMTVDAFKFFEETRDEKYDVVYMDAFLKPSEGTDATGVPERLKTVKFFGKIQSQLNPNGLVVFNINPHDGLEDDIQSIEEVFHTTLVFSSPGATNVVVVGSRDAIDSEEVVRERAAELDGQLEDSHSFVELLEHCTSWKQ